MLKKINLIFITCLFVILCGMKGAFAYELPESYYYVTFSDTRLGEITLLFPKDKVAYLSLEEETQIINIGSSSITAYSNDLDYTVSFQPFEYGRYRINNQSQYTYLDIIEIIETNIDFFDDQSIFIDNDLFIPIMFLFVGGVLCLILLKR